MQYTFTAHAETRLNGRNIDADQIKRLWHTVPGETVHRGRTQKDLVIDGLDVRVIAERTRRGWHVVTVHFIGDHHTDW